jgi:hypothetical protein
LWEQPFVKTALTAIGLAIALVSLGGVAPPARGDAYTWQANQNRGPQWDCSERSENTFWKVTETDATLVVLSDDTGRYHIHIRRLNSDGSGRVAIKDTKGRSLWFEFDAGHGPRKIRFNVGNRACVWTLEPI